MSVPYRVSIIVAQFPISALYPLMAEVMDVRPFFLCLCCEMSIMALLLLHCCVVCIFECRKVSNLSALMFFWHWFLVQTVKMCTFICPIHNLRFRALVIYGLFNISLFLLCVIHIFCWKCMATVFFFICAEFLQCHSRFVYVYTNICLW